MHSIQERTLHKTTHQFPPIQLFITQLATAQAFTYRQSVAIFCGWLLSGQQLSPDRTSLGMNHLSDRNRYPQWECQHLVLMSYQGEFRYPFVEFHHQKTETVHALRSCCVPHQSRPSLNLHCLCVDSTTGGKARAHEARSMLTLFIRPAINSVHDCHGVGEPLSRLCCHFPASVLRLLFDAKELPCVPSVATLHEGLAHPLAASTAHSFLQCVCCNIASLPRRDRRGLETRATTSQARQSLRQQTVQSSLKS